MKIRTVLITGDFKESQGESDFVDIHCELKFTNGEILKKTVENFPYSASAKNISFDILEDEIFHMVEKLNLDNIEMRVLTQKSQDALERFVYKVWRTEGSI
jgi:hypothetical protein